MAEPILSVRDLHTHFFHGRRRGARGRRHLVRSVPRPHARHRRRIRLRQERHRALHPAHRRTPRPHRRRRDPAASRRRAQRRPREARLRQRGDARDPRRRDRPGVPGADELAVGIPHDRQPDHRGDPPALHPVEARGTGARDRTAGNGRHPASGAARRRLFVRTVRRTAPARDDRTRARRRTAHPDRRRTDDRAGCHHPGADPGTDPPHAAGARPGGDPDHPRHGRDRRDDRRRGGHVSRPRGGEGSGRRDLPRAAASVYTVVAALDPQRAGRAAGTAGDDRGFDPASLRAATRLPVPSALSGSHRAVSARSRFPRKSPIGERARRGLPSLYAAARA